MAKHTGLFSNMQPAVAFHLVATDSNAQRKLDQIDIQVSEMYTIQKHSSCSTVGHQGLGTSRRAPGCCLFH